MSLCENAGPLDFQNPCIRATWASLLPATLVLVLCLSAFPLPHVAHNFTSILKTPTIFQPFLTLEEAEALNASADGGADVATAPEKGAAVAPLWRTAILVFVGLAETLGWLSFGSYNIPNDAGTPWTKTLPFFVAFTWLYTVVRPVARPIITVPLDLFFVYALLLVAAVVQLGSIAYDYTILDVPLPSGANIFALLLNFFAILDLFTIVLNVPFAIPSERARKEGIVRVFSFASTSTQTSADREEPFPLKITLPCGSGLHLAGCTHW